MRRRLAALAATSALVLALSAAPALGAGSPLMHMMGPVEDLGTLCGYTFQPGGYYTDTFRPGDIGEDGIIHAAHLTLHNAWATDEAGDWFRVLGGETYRDGWGVIAKIMFVRQSGGIDASISIVVRDAPSGGFIHDVGSCSFI